VAIVASEAAVRDLALRIGVMERELRTLRERQVESLRLLGLLSVRGKQIVLGTPTSEIGFFGATPAARPAAYTVTNGLTDRAYDADSTSTEELADVLATIIADLKTLGLLQ
jgi:hypothetical protein